MARLAAVIDDVVDEHFNGNVLRAAEGIGIERTLLSRLQTGEAKSFALRDLTRLREFLSREEFAEIERSLVSERAAKALTAFDAWIRRERDRLLYRPFATETDVGQAVASVVGWEMQRELEYRHLLAIMRTRFPALFSGFDRWLQLRQHSLARGELAYIRILSPLLDCMESGCIERRWQEMSESELLRFIKAGVTREQLLMDRPSEVRRAQEYAERDPIDFLALYGQLWDPRAFAGPRTNNLLRRWIASRSRKKD